MRCSKLLLHSLAGCWLLCGGHHHSKCKVMISLLQCCTAAEKSILYAGNDGSAHKAGSSSQSKSRLILSDLTLESLFSSIVHVFGAGSWQRWELAGSRLRYWYLYCCWLQYLQLPALYLGKQMYMFMWSVKSSRITQYLFIPCHAICTFTAAKWWYIHLIDGDMFNICQQNKQIMIQLLPNFLFFSSIGYI